MANIVINNIFTSFQEFLDNEQDAREQIRSIVNEIDKVAREIMMTMQVIHQDNGLSEIPNCCSKARELYQNVRNGFEKLAALIPAGQYYRYYEHWRRVAQKLCFLISLVVFLEVGMLISKETAASVLGIKNDAKEGFHLELEDYLMGILNLSSELARLAVNSVTCGDYTKPFQISEFVAELNAGFRLLNMKNDSLRKRYDVLKYDVKKIEEVVYDLSIRGLKP
ncbi:PREDICTED: translin [Nicrophorus vespilloides]|uniref:Translin n=1 Tax=Nicrophorus vespilloides TaxID=110193 RepID=A0ABM1MPP6_NICVS|nr:PREDICTED: translin [Nicrophorus vespilloides]